MLISPTDPPIALFRLEAQPGGQSGLHLHAHCDKRGDLAGPLSINMSYTLPDHGRPRRRKGAWTKLLFTQAAASFFNINLPSTDAQKELDL